MESESLGDDMSRRTSTLLAIAVALPLLATLIIAPAIMPVTESGALARARDATDSVAHATEQTLGDDYRVSARLVELVPYRGRLGLPAWQADYELTITASAVPVFSQSSRTSRAFGVGATTTDDQVSQRTRLFESVENLEPARRTALLAAIADNLGNAGRSRRQRRASRR